MSKIFTGPVDPQKSINNKIVLFQVISIFNSIFLLYYIFILLFL